MKIVAMCIATREKSWEMSLQMQVFVVIVTKSEVESKEANPQEL